MELEDYIPQVEEFYRIKHSGRKLQWHHLMSNGIVSNLSASLFSFSLLLLHLRWAGSCEVLCVRLTILWPSFQVCFLLDPDLILGGYFLGCFLSFFVVVWRGGACLLERGWSCYFLIMHLRFFLACIFPHAQERFKFRASPYVISKENIVWKEGWSWIWFQSHNMKRVQKCGGVFWSRAVFCCHTVTIFWFFTVLSFSQINFCNDMGRFDLEITTFQMAVLFAWNQRPREKLSYESLRLATELPDAELRRTLLVGHPVLMLYMVVSVYTWYLDPFDLFFLCVCERKFVY